MIMIILTVPDTTYYNYLNIMVGGGNLINYVVFFLTCLDNYLNVVDNIYKFFFKVSSSINGATNEMDIIILDIIY